MVRLYSLLDEMFANYIMDILFFILECIASVFTHVQQLNTIPNVFIIFSFFKNMLES